MSHHHTTSHNVMWYHHNHIISYIIRGMGMMTWYVSMVWYMLGEEGWRSWCDIWHNDVTWHGHDDVICEYGMIYVRRWGMDVLMWYIRTLSKKIYGMMMWRGMGMMTWYVNMVWYMLGEEGWMEVLMWYMAWWCDVAWAWWRDMWVWYDIC